MQISNTFKSDSALPYIGSFKKYIALLKIHHHEFLEERHYVNTGYLVTIYRIFLSFLLMVVDFFPETLSSILKQSTPPINKINLLPSFFCIYLVKNSYC